MPQVAVTLTLVFATVILSYIILSMFITHDDIIGFECDSFTADNKAPYNLFIDRNDQFIFSRDSVLNFFVTKQQSSSEVYSQADGFIPPGYIVGEIKAFLSVRSSSNDKTANSSIIVDLEDGTRHQVEIGSSSNGPVVVFYICDNRRNCHTKYIQYDHPNGFQVGYNEVIEIRIVYNKDTVDFYVNDGRLPRASGKTFGLPISGWKVSVYSEPEGELSSTLDDLCVKYIRG